LQGLQIARLIDSTEVTLMHCAYTVGICPVWFKHTLLFARIEDEYI